VTAFKNSFVLSCARTPKFTYDNWHIFAGSTCLLEAQVINQSSVSRVCVSFCLVAILALLLSVSVLADTIKLKDGSIYKGKVVSYNQRKFTIIIYVGSSSSQHVIPVEEIESVEFDAADIGAPSTLSTPGSAETGLARSEKPRVEPPVSQPRASEPPPSAEPKDTPPANTSPAVSGNTLNPETGDAAVTLAERSVSIAAAADWTSTEVRVQRGQRVMINASGEVDLGNNQRSSPNGIALNDSRKLMLNRPTGGLIAVIGDDNDDFVFIGANSEFTANHSGVLFLSVNEGNLKDNNGSYIAKIKVLSK
jgi:hypothetical protein